MAHSAVEGGGLLGGGCAPSHLKGPAPQELDTLDQTNLRVGGVGGGGLNSHHPNLTLVHLSCLAFSRLGGVSFLPLCHFLCWKLSGFHQHSWSFFVSGLRPSTP